MSIEDRRNYFDPDLSPKDIQRLNNPERYYGRRAIVGVLGMLALGFGMVKIGQNRAPEVQKAQQNQLQSWRSDIRSMLDDGKLIINTDPAGQDPRVLYSCNEGCTLLGMANDVLPPLADMTDKDQFIQEVGEYNRNDRGISIAKSGPEAGQLIGVPEQYAQPILQIHDRLQKSK